MGKRNEKYLFRGNPSLCKCRTSKLGSSYLAALCSFGNFLFSKLSAIVPTPYTVNTQEWVRNFKNLVSQKQNAISKTRAQYAKRHCAFKLFKVHSSATNNAKNASFHKQFFKVQRT
jgi:hypothetical protein